MAYQFETIQAAEQALINQGYEKGAYWWFMPGDYVTDSGEASRPFYTVKPHPKGGFGIWVEYGYYASHINAPKDGFVSF